MSTVVTTAVSTPPMTMIAIVLLGLSPLRSSACCCSSRSCSACGRAAESSDDASGHVAKSVRSCVSSVAYCSIKRALLDHFGSSKAVAQAGLADQVLPLEQLGPEIVRRVQRRPAGGSQKG